MQAETPSWVFVGVSLHLQTKKRPTVTTTDSSQVENQPAPEQSGVGTDSLAADGLSLSRFADQGSNPNKQKLLPPPPPPAKWYPSWGGGG